MKIILIIVLGCCVITSSIQLIIQTNKANKYFKWYKFELMKKDIKLMQKQGAETSIIQKYIEMKYRGIFNYNAKQLIKAFKTEFNHISKMDIGIIQKTKFVAVNVVVLIKSLIKKPEYNFDVEDVIKAENDIETVISNSLLRFIKKEENNER